MTSCITTGRATAIAIASLLLFGVPRAGASLIVIPNFSFNTPELADDDATDSDVDGAAATPGWSLGFIPNGIIVAGVWDPTNVDYTGSTGNNAPLPGTADGGQTAYLYLEQFDDLDPQFLLSEFMTSDPVTTIQANTVYTLRVALGRSKTFDTGDISVVLQSEGQQIASTFVPSGSLPADMFTDVVTTYTALPGDSLIGKPLSITIVHTTGELGAREVDVDNIRLDASTVPEPAGAALALLALGGAATTRRKRR